MGKKVRNGRKEGEKKRREKVIRKIRRNRNKEDKKDGWKTKEDKKEEL